MALVAKLAQQLRSRDLHELMAALRSLRAFAVSEAATAELYALPLEALAHRLLAAVRAAAREGRAPPAVPFSDMFEFFAAQLVACLEALQPQAALRLYLAGALVASEVAQDAEAAARLLRLALELFDLHCGFQREGAAGLQLICNALLRVYVLAPGPREALLAQVRRYASSLVSREAQVRRAG